ncbi:MAG: hypothetical protein AB1Z98_32110 [Nannocystaceae bacterium]
MVEDRTRHDRLRSLLPATYATNPRDSAVGVVLEVLADRLREADQAIERGLRDKWLLTAQAAREVQDPQDPPGGLSAEIEPLPTVDLGDRPLPLEYLGAALDLLRQPWEADTEAYRRRVKLLAPLLAGGLGTPRAIIAMALSALGSEPCPRLTREGNETRGIGLPSGSLDRCRACRGGRRPPPGPCPLREQATMSARVVDNPRSRVSLVREQLRPGATEEARIYANNLSLFADRPELTLSIPAGASTAAVVPRFRSLRTGEELVIARVLQAGDTLSVRGPSPYDPERPRHRQQWVDRPAAFAAAPAQVRVGVEVDVPVIASEGSRFDSAVFGPDVGEPADAATFTVTRLVDPSELEVPAMLPGANTWVYQPLTRSELDAAVADLDPAEDLGALPDSALVPEDRDDTQVQLVLRWWVRAPSRFRLRIPRTPAVQAAETAGAAGYLRRLIDRARPIGVLPVIDFLQPIEPESLDPRDGLGAFALSIAEPVEPGDVLPQDLRLDEQLGPEDGGGFIGVFDVTIFDFSVFSETEPEPGEFDSSYFDFAEFNE